ncbi:MAG: O-antigen ligase family protein [Chloroflexi bacterium]|nr:O-antigen ligase family protein [Chloroflexota bacterium]
MSTTGCSIGSFTISPDLSLAVGSRIRGNSLVAVVRSFLAEPFSARGPAPTDFLAMICVVGEWAGLARAVVGAPVLAFGLDVLLVSIVVIVLVATVRLRPRLPWTPMLLVATYIALAAAEIFNPNVPSAIVGLEGFRKTAFTMVSFFVAAFTAAAGGGSALRFAKIVALGSVPAFLWAIRQAVFPLPIDQLIVASSGVSPTTFHSGVVLRAFAPTSGPFHLGILAAFVTTVALVSALRDVRWAALGGLAAAVLGLTLTRANIAAEIVAILVIVMLVRPVRAAIRAALPAAPMIVVLVVTALLAGQVISLPPSGGIQTEPGPSSSPVASGRPTPAPTVAPVLVNPLEDKNLDLRLGYWGGFLDAVRERPVLGWGTSSAADGLEAPYRASGDRHFAPHSIYFKAALELGIPGFILLVTLLGWTIVASVRLLRTRRSFALIAIGMLAAMLVAGLTGPMLDAYPMNAVFWSMCGFLVVEAGRDETGVGPPAPDRLR